VVGSDVARKAGKCSVSSVTYGDACGAGSKPTACTSSTCRPGDVGIAVSRGNDSIRLHLPRPHRRSLDRLFRRCRATRSKMPRSCRGRDRRDHSDPASSITLTSQCIGPSSSGPPGVFESRRFQSRIESSVDNFCLTRCGIPHTLKEYRRGRVTTVCRQEFEATCSDQAGDVLRARLVQMRPSSQ